MKVKGSAVRSTSEFVKKYYTNGYTDWFNSLDEKTKEIIQNNSVSKWYPINEGLTHPTQKIIELFYNNDTKGAYETGKFSADIGLNGIYKFFIKMGSPNFIISKSASVFGTYYKDAIMTVISKTSTSVILDISNFSEYHILIEQRVIGWIEKALELSGCKNIKTNIVKSICTDDNSTELFITWE